MRENNNDKRQPKDNKCKYYYNCNKLKKYIKDKLQEKETLPENCKFQHEERDTEIILARILTDLFCSNDYKFSLKKFERKKQENPTETQADTQADTQAETDVENQPEAQPEAQPEPKVVPKIESKPKKKQAKKEEEEEENKEEFWE